MAYPQPLIKLSFGGSMADEDIWTNGLSIIQNTAADTIALFGSLEAQDFAAAAAAFYVNGSPSANNYVSLDWIKIALVGTDGKYLQDAKIYDLPVPDTGAGTFAVSPQDSVVVSLVTDFKRGLAKRGRIYLPAGFSVPVATDGRLSSTSITGLLAKVKIFFDAIEVIISGGDLGGRIVVASSVGAGMFHEVTSLEIGNIMDNQNRRRNRLQEIYTSLALN